MAVSVFQQRVEVPAGRGGLVVLDPRLSRGVCGRLGKDGVILDGGVRRLGRRRVLGDLPPAGVHQDFPDHGGLLDEGDDRHHRTWDIPGDRPRKLTNVSVAISYTLSAVSAAHRM